MIDVDVTSEPIELYKLLKFAGVVDSGGEAKAVVAEGLVQVNQSVETQKRKKVRSGDIITFGEDTIQIRLKTE